MLSIITVIGRPTRDPELQSDRNGALYTRVDLAVNKGYGEKEHANFYTGWLKGDAAERIIHAGVKKGSLIYLTGDLDMKPYTKRDGTTGTACNINVYEWGYAAPAKAPSDENAPAGQTPAKTSPTSSKTQPSPQNGAAPSYNPYPNTPVQPQFEELGDEEELPF